MSRMADLVKDWGGFEELVKDLHNTGNVTVERDVVLKGKSGQERQIDVLIKHQEGLYTHKIIVECKHWNSKVKRSQVDALSAAIQDLNASKGVIFTSKGFQSGAIGYAQHNGIDLFIVRDLTDEEWGQPGRKIDFYIQFIFRSIRNINAQIRLPETIKNPPKLDLYIEEEGNRSKTELYLDDGSADKDLEECLITTSLEAMQKVMKESFLINSGEECTRYMQVNVPVHFANPRYIRIDNQFIKIDDIQYDLLIKIRQTRFCFDRAKPFSYALMVEDCVTGSKTIASHRKNDKHTNLTVTKSKIKRGNEADILENGSILQLFTTVWFDPKECEGLTPIPMSKLKKNPM